MATGAEQHGGMFDRSRPHTATNRPGSKSRRKIKVLPWCQDEKDRQIHTDYVKLLASMDSKSRAKASKHAIAAACSLLKEQRKLKISTSGGKSEIMRITT